jgi:hypothetical protein
LGARIFFRRVIATGRHGAERLSVLSSELSNVRSFELLAHLTRFGVESNQKFVRQRHANHPLGFSSSA